MMVALVLRGFFGKIPCKGDFVGRGLPADFIKPWEAWANNALRGSRALLGGAWAEAWRQAPVWRFSLPGGACGPHAALGLVLPSVDRVGRAWPLVVAALFQGHVKPALPCRYRAFLEQIEDAAREAIATDVDPDRLAGKIAGFALPAFDPADFQDALWWTEGAPSVAAQCLAVPGLPAMPHFAALLAGGEST